VLKVPLGSRGSAPDPAVGAHSTPPDPLAGGEGVAALYPGTETLLCTFGLGPPMKNPDHPLA